MNRRSFLVAAAALSAGCIGNSNPSNPSTETTDTPQPGFQTTTPLTGSSSSTPTTTPQLTEPRSVTIVNLSQGNLGQSGIKAEATLLTDTITTEHPARIRLTLSALSKTNVSYLICEPVTIAENPDNSNKLVLKEGNPPTGTSNCWRFTAPLEWGRPCFSKSSTITSSSPFSRTYTIWDHPANRSCFPTGTYHVKDGFTVKGTQYHWSFGIRVSD